MKLDVTKAMNNAKATMSDCKFQQAGSALSEAKNFVREEAQKRTSSDIEIIIDKLKSNAHISSEEIALIKSWIIGDAVGYTKMENDFQGWLSEFDRLRNSIEIYEKKGCSSKDLLNLHGLLEDATRVCYDIANFLEKKDRISKFEAAISDGVDDNERDVLAKVLTGKLRSSEY